MTENEIILANGGDCRDAERTIYIGGVLLPTTSEPPSYTFSDLDNEGIRPFTTGVLIRNRIRENVMSIELQWNMLSSAQVEEIFDLVRPQTFQVNVYDRTQKKRVVKTMYASADKKLQETKYIHDGYLSSLSFSLIEC